MKKEDPPHGDRLADDFLNIAVFRVGLRFTNQGSRGKCTCHCDRLRIAAKGVLGMPLSDANLKELETMGAPQVRLHVSQWSGQALAQILVASRPATCSGAIFWTGSSQRTAPRSGFRVGCCFGRRCRFDPHAMNVRFGPWRTFQSRR